MSARKGLHACIGALLVLAGAARAGDGAPATAPEFAAPAQSAWLNSAPLTLAGLRGRPILIEFWTFECVNCLRTIAWMKHVERSYGPRGLAVVAVHTPEFAHERESANVREALKRLEIGYPVLLDPDYHYWKAIGNRYWPAFYLVDARGRVVATAIGEMHAGTARAQRFEQMIGAALAPE